MAYTKYSLTPANNTATPPDGAPEGMLPSAVNDTMRDMMAQIRDCGDGIRDGTYTMTAPKITGGTITGSTINNSAIGGTTAAAGKFTTLEATGVTTVQAGTVSLPAITTSGDTNTGIFFPAADTIAFAEGGAEAMRITSTGNLGIGVTPAASTVVTLQLGTSTFSEGGGATSFASNMVRDTTWKAINTGTSGLYQIGGDFHFWYTAASVSGGTSVSLTERMRIDSSGNLLVGTTTSNGRLTVTGVDATGSNFSLYCRNNTAAAFYVRNDGYINTGLLAVSPYNYSTTGRAAIIDVAGGFGYLASVRAAKANIQNLTNISWVYNLNPVEFNYRKKDKDNKFTEEFESEKYYGLVAEEVESVNKELCFYDADGTLRGVSYDKLTSILLKAIQELNAKVEAQAAEIALLKSK
jgi:hypothetical protein